MKTNPCTLVIDGSNDSDLTKFNPLTVKIFDISFSKVTSNLLDMCTTKDATSHIILKNCQCFFTKSDKCVDSSVDKISVNMVKRNSIRLVRIMSIPTTFRHFRVLMSEMLCRRLPVLTLLL